VAGFILFFNFSPSLGSVLTYYSTDVLHFSKTFQGTLASLSSASGLVGAALYFAVSKSVPFNRLIHFAIGAGVITTLAYLGYRSQESAVVLSMAVGGVTMIMHLIFLDLAAKACPKQAEGTFFALLMSVFNGGSQISNITGGWLYGQMGFTTLILISAASTALCWLLVPLLKVGGGASQPGTDSVVSLVPAAS
jgi:Na+/melibiose symporter-like transporter